jgi:hypothetical protein
MVTMDTYTPPEQSSLGLQPSYTHGADAELADVPDLGSATAAMAALPRLGAKHQTLSAGLAALSTAILPSIKPLI